MKAKPAAKGKALGNGSVAGQWDRTVAALADAICVLDENGRILQCNPAMEKILGRSRDAIMGRVCWQLVHGTAEPIPDCPVIRARQTKCHAATTLALGDRYFEITADPVLDTDGRVANIVHVMTDVTGHCLAEQRILQLNRLLRTISEVNQLIVHEADRDRLLHETCRILVESARFQMAWVGFMDAASGLVTPAAAAGVDEGYTKTIRVRWDDSPEGRGPTGTAIRTGEHRVLGDVEHDADYAPWRDMARQRKFRSSAAFPLRVRDQVVGALSVYADTADAFNGDEVALLDELAMDLGYALQTLDDRATRDRAEAAQKASEERFRAVMETIPDLVWLKDPEGVFLACNHRFEQLFGVEEARIVKRTDYDFVSREQADFFRDHDRKAMAADGPTVNEEWVTFANDGHRELLETIKTPMYDSPGRLVGVLGVGRDITGRKQAEEALRNSEARFRELFNNMTSGVAIYEVRDEGTEFVFRDINETGLRLGGLQRGEVIGRVVTEVFPGIRKMGLLEVFQRVWKTGIAERYPATHYTDAHLSRWYENCVFKLPSGELVTVYDDITERKAAEEALSKARKEIEESERLKTETIEKLNEAQEVAKIGSWDWNLATNAVWWSVEVYRLFGLVPQEYTPSFEMNERFVHPADRERYRTAFSQALETGEMLAFETRILAGDGSTKYCSVLGRCSSDATGKPVRFVGTIMDVTERWRAEDALHRLNRELRAISNCNQALLRATDETTLLNEICRIICDDAGYRMAWVGYAEHDAARSVRPVAWAGFDGGYIANAKISWAENSERGQGAAGLAIRSGDSVYIQDVATDPRLAPWREGALRRGYRSVVALPLREPGAPTFGALMIYATEPNAFVPDERRLLEELANDLAFGLVALRTSLERRRAEARFSLAAAKLRELGFIIDHSPAVAILWKAVAGWPVEYVSENIRQFGYSPDDFTSGRVSYASVLHPDDLERVAAEVAQYSSEPGRDEYSQEYRIVSPQGRVFWLDDRSWMRRNDRGEITHFQGIIQDITERKRAAEALRESELRYRTLADSGQALIWTSGLDKKCDYFNQPWLHFTGRTLEQELGDGWVAGVHPEDLERCVQTYVAAFDRHEPFSMEYRLRHASGEYRWIQDNGMPRFDHAGQFLGYIGHCLDISGHKQAEAEREKLQAQLNQVQKMESIGRLAGGVAHDFNNMLAAILGHTELALDKVEPAHPIFDDLREIQKAAERSADLTRQLLAFARKQTVSPRVLDLNETVAGMLKMLRRLIREGIELVWQPEPELGPVKMDPSQLDQILANLAVNARDAIGGVGTFSIATRNAVLEEVRRAGHEDAVADEYVALVVSDTGCGMSRDVLGHLFEPFFTTKGMGEGTGLGLATVYGIIRQNHGFVTVDSEPGRGTTFKIYLPRYQGKAGAQPRAVPPPVLRGRETVLLVEDEPAILKITTTMLERLDYVVLAASTPGEAIRLAKEHHGEIHLLMTDVVMPEMNGRDLAKNLLSLYPNLKRLFMSGYTANVIAHHGVLDEGVNFIQKPFSKTGLATKLREVLDGG